MKQADAAQMNETGQECSRNKMGQGSPRCYMNWLNRNVGQQKLKEGITYETGMADTSACKPRSSKVNKGKRYHSKNNVVTWQEHQPAHR